MLGLKLRPEFTGKSITGTAVSLDSTYKNSFVNQPTSQALEITYPSVDLLQALEACFGPENNRYLVIMGERGQGKSHIMGVIHHAFKDPKTFSKWLESWKPKLSYQPKIELPSTEFLVITVALHDQGFEFLWDPIFKHHPEGQRLQGKWEAKKDTVPVPSRDDLIEALKKKPVALIFDEFQTWYANLSGKPESWAFNFIQILTEIAKKHPELLKLVVSVRNGQGDAYGQLHRESPRIVNFSGAASKQDRQKLLLHRIFENRGQISADQIKGKIDTYFTEWCRLLNKSGSEKTELENQMVTLWPFAIDLIGVLEEQILVATNAQETRDLIQILVALYKTAGEQTSILTPAHFGLDEEASPELEKLLTSLATAQTKQLAKIALRNLHAVRDNLKENCPPFTAQALSALYIRSLNPARQKGVKREQLQADISHAQKYDDNAFKDAWAQIEDNSYNVHKQQERYFFDIPENARTKVLVHAKNSKHFENGQDIEKVIGIAEWAYSPRNSADKSRFRYSILGKNWRSEPFVSGKFKGVMPSEVGEGQPCYVFIPEALQNGELKQAIGRFLVHFVPTHKNLVRFVIPNKNIFADKAILLNARALYFADSWKDQDAEYARLKEFYQTELEKELGNAFNKVVIVSRWDHENFHNIQFEEISVAGRPGQMFSEVDQVIVESHFSIDDFKALVAEAVKSNNLERQKLSNIRRIIEEPRPFPNAVIPWTSPTHIFEVILHGVITGKYAIQGNHGVTQLSQSNTPDSIRRDIQKPQWSRWDSLHVVPMTGPTGSAGIPSPGPSSVIGGASPVGGAQPGNPTDPAPPTGAIVSKIIRDLGYGQSPLQALDQIERWGIAKSSKLHDVSVVFTTLTGEQLKKVLQLVDGTVPDSEINLKLVLEEDKE